MNFRFYNIQETIEELTADKLFETFFDMRPKPGEMEPGFLNCVVEGDFFSADVVSYKEKTIETVKDDGSGHTTITVPLINSGKVCVCLDRGFIAVSGSGDIKKFVLKSLFGKTGLSGVEFAIMPEGLEKIAGKMTLSQVTIKGITGTVKNVTIQGELKDVGDHKYGKYINRLVGIKGEYEGVKVAVTDAAAVSLNVKEEDDQDHGRFIRNIVIMHDIVKEGVQ